MADDLTVAFKRLRTATQRLNGSCDAAAQTVRDVEAFLEETQIGIGAWLVVKSVDHELGETDCSFLGDTKYRSGKFRHTISDEIETVYPADFPVFSWSEAPRDDKPESFEKPPELMLEVAKRVDERLAPAELLVADVTAKLPITKMRKGGANESAPK